MRRRSYLKSAGLIAVAGTAGCSGVGGGGGGGGPINVAALEPLSGPFGPPFSEPHQLGLEIAIEEANQELDRELQLLVTDTGSDAEAAASAFDRHVEQDEVVAVTGAVSSDVGIRLAQVAENQEVPNFLNQAGAEEILSRDSRYTFRVGWLPAPSHAKTDIEFAASRGYSNVGAIIGDYSWGRAYEQNIREQAPSDLSLQVEAAPVGAEDFSSYLRRFSEDIDAITLTGHPPGAFTAMNQSFELGMDLPLIDGSPPQQLLISGLGDNITNGVIGHTLADVESQAYHDLGERVAERGDRTMYNFETYGYVTGKMIAEAVAETDATSTAVADYVRSNTFDYDIYNNPISYTEWGELEQPIHAYFDFVAEEPSYDSEASVSLNLLERTAPLEPFDPSG